MSQQIASYPVASSLFTPAVFVLHMCLVTDVTQEMPKCPADTLKGTSTKRKHNRLSIAKKVELLKELERSVPVRKLSDDYRVGTSAIYDIKKLKKTNPQTLF